VVEEVGEQLVSEELLAAEESVSDAGETGKARAGDSTYLGDDVTIRSVAIKTREDNRFRENIFMHDHSVLVWFVGIERIYRGGARKLEQPRRQQRKSFLLSPFIEYPA
jgi:hypothetical protein